MVLIINQDASRAPARKKRLDQFRRKNSLRTIICRGSELDATLQCEIRRRNIKRVIIAGGDGSVALAVQHILTKRPSVQLAVIPVGTANYYAKTLGIRSLTRAFSVAVGDSLQQRYVCEGNGRFFILAANIGLTSRMFHNMSDLQKRRFGKWSYVWGVIKVFWDFTPLRVTIQANNETYRYTTTELHVINQSISERVHLQPHVDARQPYFEIVTYGLRDTKLSPIIGALVFIVTFGKNQRYIKRIRATKAVITTNREEGVSLDGDSATTTPLSVQMCNKSVYMCCFDS